MPVVIITRKISISCAHKLFNPNISNDENTTLFGKCVNLHGHNYKIYASFKGEINETTGMVINLSVVNEILQEYIVKKLDHKNLDYDVPELAETITSTENLAVFVWNTIMKNILEKGENTSILYEVKIKETDKNSVIYRGE